MTQNDEKLMKSRGLTQFEESLANWDRNDDDTCDKAHAHFTALEHLFGSWYDVSDEGRRLFLLMFDEHVESGSPKDAVLAGIAAAAYELAIARVANCIGVDAASVREAIETCGAADAAKFINACASADAPRGNKEAT